MTIHYMPDYIPTYYNELYNGGFIWIVIHIRQGFFTGTVFEWVQFKIITWNRHCFINQLGLTKLATDSLTQYNVDAVSMWPTYTRLQYIRRIIHTCMGVFYWIWWRHQNKTFSALLALSAGNSSVIGEFPAQGPVTQSCDVFFRVCLNRRLSIQS